MSASSRAPFLAAVRRLPRTVWVLGLISLVNDGASEMIYPLVPLYLGSVLMAGPRTLGLIEGLAEATGAIFKLVTGVVVDRARRTKPLIGIGYGIAALGRPLIAFAASWPALLAIRVADRLGKGLRSTPRDALLAGAAPPGDRGLAFGLHRAMDNAGALLGPAIAWALLSNGVPLRSVFLWALVPGAVCFALTFAVDEPAHSSAPKTVPFDWHVAGLARPIRRYLAVVALFTLGNSSNMFLLLRARELGTPEALVPVLWAAVSAVAMVFTAPLSALSDSVGRVRLLMAGYAAYGLFYAALGLRAAGGPGLYTLFGAYGLFMAATEGVEKALVADLAEPAARGRAFGWFNLVSGLFLLPASLIFGGLYESLGATTAFGFASACALLSAIALPLAIGREPSSGT